MSTHVPSVIAELRKAWLASDATLAELGERMGGSSPQQVSAALKATYDIRLSTLTRLAHALGYDLALIPRKDTP